MLWEFSAAVGVYFFYEFKQESEIKSLKGLNPGVAQWHWASVILTTWKFFEQRSSQRETQRIWEITQTEQRDETKWSWKIRDEEPKFTDGCDFVIFISRLQPSMAVDLLSYRVVTGTSFLFSFCFNIKMLPTEISALVIAKNWGELHINPHFTSTICDIFKNKNGCHFILRSSSHY